MKYSKTLIIKFLRGECNEDERRIVEAFIRRHPEALQPYLTEDTWHAFQSDEQLPESVSEKMLAVIESRTYLRKRSNWRYFSWAAAVLLLIAGGLYWITFPRPTVKQTALAQPAKTAPIANNQLKQVYNNGRKTMNIRLADGSIIELAPGSQVEYADPFASNKRTVTLKGQAVFRVTGSQDHPFTVVAGNVGTTALGTVFKITAWENKHTTHVKLFSGKVLVRTEHSTPGLDKDIYLLPGQELSYDRQKMLLAVNAPVQAVKPGKQPERINEILSFNNEPLENIFKQLSDKYQVKIQYTPAMLTDMNFTGVFDSSKETLKEFLSTIGTLNNLTISQKSDVVYIIQ
ncbi:ferric-dicitrate binding protein FerR (iron transport regulator) [Chitinophaga terrae (ex Kim and Jung 2007)]|uniref:FecR family protein n=1 Tax=Chitinophaga terrae (ex Kim and Jung 2007) TaxID=408074 RepID=UPI002789991C|nr:FecR domain-containing protein [Chitinophaga terrae (ex Kim and Jung 2007)]MDQ0104957.1 ferric-dicitrate binding protein FerR (iron transport regulator) [Chitinophaga terrae (ex Kim and Jung 2007)]